MSDIFKFIKKVCAIVAIFSISCLVLACNNEKKNEYFDGEVIKKEDTYIIVKPFDSKVRNDYDDKIYVPIDDLTSPPSVETLAEGQEVRVLYSEISKQDEKYKVKNTFSILNLSDVKE